MKKLKFLLLALVAFCSSVCFTSCLRCGDGCIPPHDAYKIEGTYIGILSVNGTVIEDIYTVNVSAIGEDAVAVYADFYSS